jgi:hypothetical protein
MPLGFQGENIPAGNAFLLKTQAEKFSVSPFTKGDDFGRLF